MHKETVLRANLISSLERIDFQDLGKLTLIIEDTYGGLVKGVVTNQLLVDTAFSAVKNDRWVGSTSRASQGKLVNVVGVGYYVNDSDYYTNFGHELCHNLVWQMGRPNYVFEDYADMADAEEKMCWEFSIELCKITSKPFSEEVLEISQRYWKLVQSLFLLSNDAEQSIKFVESIRTIGLEEKQLFGFSILLDDKFCWENDIPKLL